MGGGAMRTVAKVAALAGTRRSTFPPGTTAAAATAATATAVHVAPAGEPQPPLVSITAPEKEMLYPAGTQWPALDVEDSWELAGSVEEEEVLIGSDVSDPPSRLVFGSPPTLEEAKEAASDLKEALEKTYFSPHMNEASVNAHHVSEGTVHPIIPKHVAQVFSLLQAPEAQSVVASLASDKNLLDAISKNEKFVGFFKNHQSVLPAEKDAHLETYDNKSIGSMESPLKETSENSSFTDWMENVRLKVSEVVNNISYFLQEFMGSSPENKAQTSTTTAEDYVDLALGASFMSLAVATILVVLVKRG
ncbi:uncharacterized protein M6B38_376460 [Iris pallida]|uniref:Uncharacterized protein n=1 Tax=Iris pallida TaxID=29817 RepID=A0AAX6GB91_IRIPA|nr:uncharacterized protein M6B38_376460 [Iris pallida]